MVSYNHLKNREKVYEKIISSILIVLLLLAAVACKNPNEGTPETHEREDLIDKVGILMPNQLRRWNTNGNSLKDQLEEAGYETDLRFADNDGELQITQLQEMITAGYRVIVIAAVNPDLTAEAVQGVKADGIKIIAYDRIFYNSTDISYFINFSNPFVGQLQADYIVSALHIDTQEGPFYIEFFSGDPADPYATEFYNGAADAITPYMTSGKVVCKSGQTSRSQSATQAWSTANAKTRMASLITEQNYGTGTGKQRLDAVLCSNDSTAQGVIEALIEAGYTAENMPVITGQDCERTNVQYIIDGKQSMSVLKLTDNEVTRTFEVCKAILEGNPVTVDDTTTYHDGKGYINTCFAESVVCDINNWHELLIDSGYYPESYFTNPNP